MATFLVDVDGVVAACAELMIKEINERFRTKYYSSNVGGVAQQNRLMIDDITDFDFMNPENGILTPGECKFAKENFARAQFAYDMHPYPDVKQYLDTYRNQGHEIIFVTAQWGKSVDWCHSRTRWLEQHFDAEIKDVIFAHRKEKIVGDVFIEDKAEMCEKYAAAHPRATVLMMTQPWNIAHKIEAKNIKRVRGWRPWGDDISMQSVDEALGELGWVF